MFFWSGNTTTTKDAFICFTAKQIGKSRAFAALCSTAKDISSKAFLAANVPAVAKALY